MLILLMALEVRAENGPYENLRSEVAKMACQSPPEDRHRVAVLAPVVDPEALKDCLAVPLAEVIIGVLHEFGFTLVEGGLSVREKVGAGPGMNPSAVSKIADKLGARSILTGSLAIEQEAVRVNYKMMRAETMEIIGVVSCIVPKREFPDCFLKHDLMSPTQGVRTDIPEPRRVR
jgi:TolB-like protein